ncbi:MAG TPA: replication-associated recombination protein A [Bacillota bacterium]|nr:replication-associated recombination protein A [Bacillota bacterium]
MKDKMYSLFDMNREQEMKKESPLALRMRPETLDGFVGQEDIVAPGKLLYRAIKADKLTSLILFGPPGTGKTTLAKIIANTTKSYFEQLNAVTSGVGDIRRVVEEAKNRKGMYGQRTILFIDEIHRFNKSQQDAMLPYVEDGTVILIGATTENPYFEVNDALISRSTIFRLNPLTEKDIRTLVERCINDKKKGLGSYNIEIAEEAMEHIVNTANGDVRTAFNAVELAALTTERGCDGKIHIDLKTAEECIQKRAVNYEKKGENHYDTISAFIKSMRGSDPDAALYYLAKMLYAGEDPKFIARRIMICSSEDVGNADPNALIVATSAANAVQMIGMPEARIILSQAALYVACAPKSNSAVAGIDKAMKDVENKRTGPVPLHLRNDAFKGAKEWGYGIGYKYPHSYEGNYVEQQYLPDELKDEQYYFPSDNGHEKKAKELPKLKNRNRVTIE